MLHGHVGRLTFQGGSIECEVDLGANLSLRVPMPADLDLDKGAAVAVVIRTLEGSVFRTGQVNTYSWSQPRETSMKQNRRTFVRALLGLPLAPALIRSAHAAWQDAFPRSRPCTTRPGPKDR